MKLDLDGKVLEEDNLIVVVDDTLSLEVDLGCGGFYIKDDILDTYFEVSKYQLKNLIKGLQLLDKQMNKEG